MAFTTLMALVFVFAAQLTTSLPICASEDGLSCSGNSCFNSYFKCHRISPPLTTSIDIDITDSTIVYSEESDFWFYLSLILACGILFLLKEMFSFTKCVLQICHHAELTNSELRDLFVNKTFSGPLPIERRLRKQMHAAATITRRPPKSVKRRAPDSLVRGRKRRAPVQSWDEIGDILSTVEV